MRIFFPVLLMLIALIANVVNAFHIAKRIPNNKAANTRMTYEIVDSISPLLTTQLVTCASIITAGTIVGSQKKEIESFEDEYDIFRDSILRYAGYLNEMGEAFRPLVPETIVILSYALTLSYIAADAGWKANEYNRKNIDFTGKTTNAGGPIAAIDTLLFQIIASVIFPGFIINRWVTLVAYLVNKELNLDKIISNTNIETISIGSIDVSPESIVAALPTVFGLILIPVIVKPLDELTEYGLDTTIRPFLLEKYPGFEFPFRRNPKKN